MKKNNPVRYSSAVGEVWVMATFKVKYCHRIFDILSVRELCGVLFGMACQKYGINCRKMAFDSDHVHMILDLGIYSKSELAKRLKGFVAKQMFGMVPWLKPRYFWGSGLWNPAYDIRSINDMAVYTRYLDKQKYSYVGQKTLLVY